MDLENQQSNNEVTTRRPRRYSIFLLGLAAVVLLGLVMLHSVYLAIGIAIVSLAVLFLGRNYLRMWFENQTTTVPLSASVNHGSRGSQTSTAEVHSLSPNGSPEQPYAVLGQQSDSGRPTSGEPASLNPDLSGKLSPPPV